MNRNKFEEKTNRVHMLFPLTEGLMQNIVTDNSVDKKCFLIYFVMFLLFLSAGTEAGEAYTDEPGARIPWTSYEAEAAEFSGKIISGSEERNKVSYEASGKSCVELSAEGNFVSVKSTVKADRLTFRYSIPKETRGSVNLFINNKLIESIPLSSHRIWRPKPNLPGGVFRFFDEVTVETKVKKGDVIKLVKGPEGNVVIDFVDLELIPKPIKKPDNTWLDITTCGATGNDESDDTEAIKKCIANAAAGSKKVWIPAGMFIITDQINIPEGMKVAGAGMWYSIVIKNIPAKTMRRGFQMASNTVIRDLKLDDILGDYRINGHEGIRFSSSTNVLIDGVWVSNTYGAGLLGSNATGIVIKNCRVFGTFADAIHIARKSVNCLAENNLVRNSGDDGLAIVTYNSAGCHDIIYRHNSVWYNYWGRGITMIGGDHNILEYNMVADGSKAGFLIAVEEYNNQITPYVTNFIVQNNRSIRNGDITNKVMAGIWLWGNVKNSPMSGEIRYNEIIDPVIHSITLQNWVPKEVSVHHNTIDAPGPGGERIYRILKDDFSPVVNENTDVDR